MKKDKRSLHFIVDPIELTDGIIRCSFPIHPAITDAIC